MEKLSDGYDQPLEPGDGTAGGKQFNSLLDAVRDVIVMSVILNKRKDYAKLEAMHEALEKDLAATPGLANEMLFTAIAVAGDLLLDKQFLQDKYENNGED